MKLIGVIPARYASTRMPGKPLADILGKPMICRYRSASTLVETSHMRPVGVSWSGLVMQYSMP